MRFEYLEPATLEEAVSLLSKYDGKAKPVAGGTDLWVQIRSKVVKLEYVVDIDGLPGLNYIRHDEKQGLAIGALTPIRALEKSPELRQRYPVISQAASQMASMAIRNVGTIGGNLCNAAPSADTAPALIGLGARAKIIGSEGERIVALEDFFTGPGTTILKTAELLVEIQVPVLAPNTKAVYLKHSMRGAIDLAIVGVAAVIAMDGELCQDARVVLGAVAPTPIRAKQAEEVLRGKRIDDALIEKAAQAASAESRPITDVRSSAEYRREMIKVFTRRAVREAIAA